MNQQLYIKQEDGSFIPYEDAKYTFYDYSFCYISDTGTDQSFFVKISEITLFESIGNYTKAYFGNRKPLFLSSLNTVEERLVKCTFFRANRKQLINIRKIVEVKPYYLGGLLIVLSGGTVVELSRRRNVSFKKMLGIN